MMTTTLIRDPVSARRCSAGLEPVFGSRESHCGRGEYELVPDVEAAKIWIMKNQISRRNVAQIVRVEYQTKVDEYEARKRQAKENQRLSEGRGQKGFVNSQNLKPVNTSRELAKKLNIGEQTVSRCIQIHEKATPEQKANWR
jgi:hypothetical protein